MYLDKVIDIMTLIYVQYSQNWSRMSNNPRATTYISSTKDENNLTRILGEFRGMNNPTLHYLLCKYIECNIIKNQPEFMEILFTQHIELVVEMIQWMLTPKIMARRKKMKGNLDFFPYRAKEFMRDNIHFYQELYISARNNRLPISIWFNFLRKEYYDKQTIATALGYFAEVMVPFARYEFSGSLNITQSLQNYSQIQSKKVDALSIMKILPKGLIDEIAEFCHFEPIYKFLKTAILVSIQDPIDEEISRATMLKMLVSAQAQNLFLKFPILSSEINEQVSRKIDFLQNVAMSLKQLIANIEPGNQMQLRTQSFISVIVESKIILYCINQITQSKFCYLSPREKMSNSTMSMDLASSQQLGSPRVVSSCFPVSFSQGCLPSPKNSINLIDSQEEQVLEALLKILVHSVQIFIKIPKFVPNFTDSSSSSQTSSTIIKESRNQNYKYLVKMFQEQMQTLLDNLHKMTKLVYNQGDSISLPKSMPFSSGQKIKMISLMKFQYLKLLQNCLLMVQLREPSQSARTTPKSTDKGFTITVSSPLNSKKLNVIPAIPFVLQVQKLRIIQIIQKYLCENRWNNIVHHVLQKICHCLILGSYDYLSKNIEKDKSKNLTQSFLAYLIQNFTQRDYIFLDTFKFTTQGNLQSIYNISKDLAYTLNSTNQLVVLLNDFEPWKKFIMNDLKIYEEKTYPRGTKPEEEDMGNLQTRYSQVSGLKVDQVDSIRKLIQNISENKKWPDKISKKKGTSKSGIIRNSDDCKSSDDGDIIMSKSQGFYFRRKDPLRKTLQDLVKKVQQSRQLQTNQISDSEQQSIEDKKQESSPERETPRAHLFNVFKAYANSKMQKKDPYKLY